MFSVATINFPSIKPDLLQQQLFDQIREILPSNLSLAEEISTLLKVSPDSAYRRIRGEKSLSFAEMQTLSRHFRISIDSMLKIDSGSSVCYGNWLRAKGFNFRNYLGGLLEHTQHVEQAVNKMIYYEAHDFLAFEFLPFPELCAFKYFYWIKTIIDHPAYARTSFERHDLGHSLNEFTPKLLKAYQKIPATEIVGINCVQSTLQQITQYQKMGVFDKPETANRLLEQLSDMVEHLRKQAERGVKLLPQGDRNAGAPFKLYLNEAYDGNDATLIDADGLHTVFVNHCMHNMMLTHDPEMCQNTRDYFEHVLQRSQSLNGANNPNREQFFEELQQKVQQAQLQFV
ncbi:MAG: hypothetical protein JST06_10190 [Bacteroidetes bacterium]|nr:hypothetical protein [Bacteroidota bacterium]